MPDTDIDPAVPAAQREVNAMLATMPHPDVRTPEGLAMHRAGTANNAGGTTLTPATRPGGGLPLRIFTPDGPVRATMLRIHGGGAAIRPAGSWRAYASTRTSGPRPRTRSPTWPPRSVRSPPPVRSPGSPTTSRRSRTESRRAPAGALRVTVQGRLRRVRAARTRSASGMPSSV
jgi:hypothetical protein